jgi:putative nucleotidyltransferase with HDIG domain
MQEPHSSSYAGRWVAKVHGRIVAQGGTPQQAMLASQQTRHKEKPEIVYMPHSFSLHPLLETIKSILPADQELYLVGGAVRDMMLHRAAPDLDFALPVNGIAFARKIANQLNADFLPLDEERDTGRVVLIQADGSRIFLDFASYRGENLEADLRGRDFTINAMALDIHANTILDPLEGAKDLHAKIIRACSPISIMDDPVRILRGIRMAAAFDCQIEKSTRMQMKEHAAELTRISAERQRDEIFKILKGPKPHDSIRALEMLGTFPFILPELGAMKNVEQTSPHVYDVWTHTLSVLASLENILDTLEPGHSKTGGDAFTNLLIPHLGRYQERFKDHFANLLNTDRSVRSLLFFAALYHDVCKPETQSVGEDGRIHFYDHDEQGAEVAAQRGRAFNLSNDEVERLDAIIRHHMRIHSFAARMEKENHGPSRRAIYRFFRDGGEAGIDLILLALADVCGMYGDTLKEGTWRNYLEIASTLLENYWERPQESVSPPRLLDGYELMRELNLLPGPKVGQLLEAIRENQATGKIANKEQALAFAREASEDDLKGAA